MTERYLTTADVCALLKRSPATLYRRVGRGEFPKPAEPGRWRASEVDAHLSGRLQSEPATEWEVNDVAIAEAESAIARNRPWTPRRRHVQRHVSRPPRTTPRLAFVNPAASDR